ncbi:MAG: rhodanese-like domain-containing protein [Armatimonadota bacterium]|nr:rhodanese-like domain-containing protein [Armatimonadota bacterium]MCX7778222.1 rhodanese-like domain-containing protein [Armatimonadota bacterium]MDW8024488.1 rhodanese-like domain-containing protein [Armatimonadota bacterium]
MVSKYRSLFSCIAGNIHTAQNSVKEYLTSCFGDEAMRIIGIAVGAASIIAASLIVGLAVNVIRPDGIPLRYSELKEILEEREKPPWLRHLPKGVEVIEFKRVWMLFISRRAKFVDARSATDYAKGHIPGAINLPAAQKEFEASFKAAKVKLPKDATIVVYCAGGS